MGCGKRVWLPRREEDGWEGQEREDQEEEPEGSAAKTELVTLVWGTAETAGVSCRSLCFF